MWQFKTNSMHPLVLAAALGVALLAAPHAARAWAFTPVPAPGVPAAPTSSTPIVVAGSASATPPASANLPTDSPAAMSGVNAIAGLVGTVRAGLVSQAPLPLKNAGVYAYRVSDLTMHKARTDPRGSFSFASLPAGVYKVIAHKTGFLPAVVLVTRTTATAFQELQLDLFPDETKDFAGGDSSNDFWQIRKRIPADVLREIQIAVADAELQDLAEREALYAPSLESAFTAKMHALSGSGTFAGASNANLVGGHVDLAGHIGDLDLGIVGNFRTLRDHSAIRFGQAKSVDFSLRHDESGNFTVSSQQGSVATASPIDLERYKVGWSGEVGPGQTNVSAKYTTEENYYRDSRLDHFELPGATRTLAIAGSYKQRFGDRAGVETGVRYRERVPSPSTSTPDLAVDPSERVEFFGLGDLSVRESMSLQYGLFTTLRNGSVAFTPHGGVVLELPNNWIAETSARQRLHQSADEWTTDFQPAHYGQQFECTSAESGCYKVQFSRESQRNSNLEFGALYRNFADTLRLYFADDLFDDLDSLFFVDGDQLPEVHFAYSRRMAPNVLARFESNIAKGGGGSVGAGLENDVRYVVTSLDTQFEGTETGVLLSFHSLEQRLLDQSGEEAFAPIAKDRLQLLITQGLSRFMGFAPDLDLILDMQISRSDEQRLADAGDEFSSRVLGGIALRF